MSPRIREHRTSTSRRAVAPVLTTLAATALFAAAPAGAATFSTIDQPLQAATVAQTATGDGAVAWAVPEQDSGTVTSAALWTVRDGVPARVTSIPTGDVGALRLEVGTDVDGTPVAVLNTVDFGGRPVYRLIDLATGATQSFSATRRGLQVGGVAVEDGTLYYTLHVAKVGARNTSALWRAPLDGPRAGTATKLRTSQRGETWGQVLADRGRVALRTSKTVRSGGRPGRLEQIAFGTPRGSWRRTGDVLFQEGPVDLVQIAGFTQDRSAVVTLQAPENGPLRATATPIRTGSATRTALLGTTAADSIGGASYVPATGRVLGVGPAADGTRSVGYTKQVFTAGAPLQR